MESNKVFARMKDLMNELIFLTDVVEDEQFEQNQEALQGLAQDYTQMFELAMSRGLVLEVDEEDGQSFQNGEDVVQGLHEISQRQMKEEELNDIKD